MADLEELALRRDRGYLVRLVLLMVLALGFALFVYGWLTGSGVSGCLAGSLGSDSETNKPSQAAPQH
jgi:hypothetical protein